MPGARWSQNNRRECARPTCQASWLIYYDLLNVCIVRKQKTSINPGLIICALAKYQGIFLRPRMLRVLRPGEQLWLWMVDGRLPLSLQVLPSYIRVIQGDGISYESLKEILENMAVAWKRSVNIMIKQFQPLFLSILKCFSPRHTNGQRRTFALAQASTNL